MQAAEWAAVARAERADLLGAVAVDARIDDELLAAGRQFERQATGMGGVRDLHRRWHAGIGYHDRAAHRQPLVT